MPDSKKPAKPTPSIEEINTYLDESAARTKKRLPLAGMGDAPKAPRALPLVGAQKTKDEADDSGEE